MVDVTLVRITELPENTSPLATDYVAADSSGGNTSRVQLQAVVNSTAPVATNTQIDAGVDNKARVTPQGLAHALTGLGTGDVPSTRRVDAGQGLAGGGDLSADRTISLDLSFADVRFQRRIERGQANGYPSLDSGGKIPTSQLPDSVLGGLIYQGNWNAATNVPAIPPSSPANKGWFYVVTTAGSTDIDGENNWNVGDWIISDGVAWSKLSNSDSVVSVNGMIGAVVIGIPEIAGLQTSLDAKLDDSQASPFGLTMLAAADAAAGRAALVLGDSATRNVGTTAGTVMAGDDARLDAKLDDSQASAFGLTMLGAADAAAGRAALVLGNSATRNVGTTAGTVAAGDDARILDVANKFNKTGGFITPATVGDWASVGLNKLASGVGSVLTGTLNGMTRWSVAVGGSEPETGGNAGSDFSVNRFADNGTYLGSPILINRKTGDMTFAAPPIIQSVKLDKDNCIHLTSVPGFTFGAGNDAPALQLALDAVANGANYGGTVILPSGGRVYLSTNVFYGADKPISILSRGGRRDCTIVQGGTNCLWFEGNGPGSAMGIYLKGIRFIGDFTAASTCIRAVNCENVEICNIRAAAGTGWWQNFFYGHAIRTSHFREWYARGDHGIDTVGDKQGNGITLTTTGVGATSNTFGSLLLQGFYAAMALDGSGNPGIEGTYIDKSEIVECMYGILWRHTGGGGYKPPVLRMINSHANCYRMLLDASAVAQVDISHCNLELNSRYGHSDIGINIAGCSGYQICHNTINFTQGSRNTVAISTPDSTMGVIMGNTIYTPGSAVAIQCPNNYGSTVDCNAASNGTLPMTVVNMSGGSNYNGPGNHVF